MAVVFLNQDDELGFVEALGLSSDTKPTATDYKRGSTFKESDTGREFLNNGAAWVLTDPGKFGLVTTAHSEIDATATSDTIDCRGFNSLQVDVDLSDTFNWTISVQGCLTSDGTFKEWHEQANTGTMVAMSYQTNTSKGFIFRGVPAYVKIVATEDASGATCTVKVQPFNF